LAALAQACPVEPFRRGVLAARLRELHAPHDCRSRIAAGLHRRWSAVLGRDRFEVEVTGNGRFLSKDNGFQATRW